MRTLLASGIARVDEYILATHSDILVLQQVNTARACRAALEALQPELLIFSDRTVAPENLEVFVSESAALVPGLKMLYLDASGSGTSERFKDRGLLCLASPAGGRDISRLLYSLRDRAAGPLTVIAVWSPKPGDGASLTCEAMAQLLWSSRADSEETVGVVDFDIKAPGLKYRFGFEDKDVLDELLPYVASGALTPGILRKYARETRKKKGLCFIGGTARPELCNRYNSTHFNSILGVAARSFDVTLIDAGSLLDSAGTVAALQNAALVFAVIQPDYLSGQCLRHALSLFPAYGIDPQKVRVLLNRFRPDLGWDPQAAVGGLGLKLAGTLPDLGSGACRGGDSPLFENQHDKAVSAYVSALRDVFEECGIAASGAKKRGTLPRIFSRGA